MSISEAPSTSSHNTPSINNSITHSKAKHKPIEITDHNGASSSATTTNNNDHGGSFALSKFIHQDLISMKEYMDHVNVQIKQAFDKFEELQTRGSPEAELQELKQAVAKLKSQIPSRPKIRSADSKPHRNTWPDVNKASDEMTRNLYKEQKFDAAYDIDYSLNAFFDFPEQFRRFLFCFVWFPPMSIIKKGVMIYLWMVNWGIDEDFGNIIFDELIVRRFIEPVNQKCSLMADSCRMSVPVHSALTTKAESCGYRPIYFLGQRNRIVDIPGCSCLINVAEPIIDSRLELFEKIKQVRALYLGRWQSSASHHIEVADTKILNVIKNMNRLKFLSLRGISLITELPSFISELVGLEILDLRACHNLEVIPNGIGSLEMLTHLDMSECYFLEYMPKGLANLSSLQVLKGFFVGDSKSNKRSCTLADLSGLRRLRKLNIYTSVKDFPTDRHLSALQQFRALDKLTISWGGCSSLESPGTDIKHPGIERHSKNVAKPTKEAATQPHVFVKKLLSSHSSKPPLALPSTLQKLDLQCFPGMSPPSWLSPANLKQLKKLYIRGGKFRNLGQSQKLDEEDLWRVEILCLKYLSELEMDSDELKMLFPRLIYLQKVKCPKLTSFPFDESVVWINIKQGLAVERNGFMNLESF